MKYKVDGGINETAEGFIDALWRNLKLVCFWVPNIKHTFWKVEHEYTPFKQQKKDWICIFAIKHEFGYKSINLYSYIAHL